MVQERLLSDVLSDLKLAKKNGALYVSAVETSEDLVRIYIENGEITDVRYGSASGNDCLDILEYYNFHSATFFEGIKSPNAADRDLPKTDLIIDQIRKLNKMIKVR